VVVTPKTVGDEVAGGQRAAELFAAGEQRAGALVDAR
jgi:hypothetical protein